MIRKFSDFPLKPLAPHRLWSSLLETVVFFALQTIASVANTLSVAPRKRPCAIV